MHNFWNVAKSKCLSLFRKEEGSTNLISLGIMGFVTILIMMYLIPELAAQNAIVQADINAGDLTKLAANIGEWFLPIAVMFGVGFIVWRKVKA